MSDELVNYVLNMMEFNSCDMATIDLTINDSPVECLIDSDASCNIISECTWKSLHVDLVPCNRRLYPYGVVKGKFNAEVIHNDKQVDAEFIVICGNSIILLGS